MTSYAHGEPICQVANNSFEGTLFASHHTQGTLWKKVLSHTRENIACAKCARCGVLFTPHVAYMGTDIACEFFFLKKKKHSPLLPSCR